MDLKNDSLARDDIVFVMLETLKSNGTFDEFRRRCISDIDAKVLNKIILFRFTIFNNHIQ